MNPETIAYQTLEGLTRFMQETFNESVSKQFASSIQNWSSTWETLKHWISQNSFRDMPSTILSFAQTLPEYESFEWHLRQSLTLHELFWNKVYSNLCLVQKLLSSP